MTSILVFAGSARRGAFSKQLAAAATSAIAEWGAKPTLIDLAEYDAPLYNGDLEDEHGIPENVLEFRRLVATHHGLAIATPEYNGCVTPLLLNLFCWASRPSRGANLLKARSVGRGSSDCFQTINVLEQELEFPWCG